MLGSVIIGFSVFALAVCTSLCGLDALHRGKEGEKRTFYAFAIVFFAFTGLLGLLGFEVILELWSKL